MGNQKCVIFESVIPIICEVKCCFLSLPWCSVYPDDLIFDKRKEKHQWHTVQTTSPRNLTFEIKITTQISLVLLLKICPLLLSLYQYSWKITCFILKREWHPCSINSLCKSKFKNSFVTRSKITPVPL